MVYWFRLLFTKYRISYHGPGLLLLVRIWLAHDESIVFISFDVNQEIFLIFWESRNLEKCTIRFLNISSLGKTIQPLERTNYSIVTKNIKDWIECIYTEKLTLLLWDSEENHELAQTGVFRKRMLPQEELCSRISTWLDCLTEYEGVRDKSNK